MFNKSLIKMGLEKEALQGITNTLLKKTFRS